MPLPFDRRRFLTGSLTTLALTSLSAHAAERPLVHEPRATSGDRREPTWEEHLTLTVGPDQGDLRGDNEKVIQAAVDAVARQGGGTVQLLPGTFRLRNAVYLASHVRLRGRGAATVLAKEPSFSSKLVQDSDWFDQEITLADARAFRLGDGICLRARNPHDGSHSVLKRTLVARSGNRFKLDRPLRENLWLMADATAATLFPILSGENIHSVVIEDLVLDGNKANNENLDGNYAGCIFLQDCNDITIRKVEARHYNGDGISWQICHDVRVEHCSSHDHTGLGMHPGSGSQRPVIRHNRLVGNDIGLFFCWGVKFGLAEKNVIEDNRASGLSIGHRDTDNLITDNDIRRSGKVGILFRPERGPAFAAHRNRVTGNRIADSGPENGIGIDVQGATAGVALTGNELRETRQPGSRIGIRLGAQTGDNDVKDNTIVGFAVPIADLRRS